MRCSVIFFRFSVSPSSVSRGGEEQLPLPSKDRRTLLQVWRISSLGVGCQNRRHSTKALSIMITDQFGQPSPGRAHLGD